MRKLNIIILFVAMLVISTGLVGCKKGTDDKASLNANSASSEKKQTESGSKEETKKPTDDVASKFGDPKVDPKNSTDMLPKGETPPKTEIKPTAPGSKGKAFVGTYSIVITPEMRKLAEDQAKMMKAQSKGKGPQVDIVKEMEKQIAKTSFVIRADGTFAVLNDGKEGVTGTYSISGNTISMTPSTSTQGGGKSLDFSYDPKTKTLSSQTGPMKTILKKK